MNFKKFNSIGDSEPRAWSQSIGTKFGKEEDVPTHSFRPIICKSSDSKFMGSKQIRTIVKDDPKDL